MQAIRSKGDRGGACTPAAPTPPKIWSIHPFFDGPFKCALSTKNVCKNEQAKSRTTYKKLFKLYAKCKSIN